VPQTGSGVLVLEGRECFQIQAAIGSTSQFNLDNVPLRDPRRLKIVFVDPKRESITPPTDLREHVST